MIGISKNSGPNKRADSSNIFNVKKYSLNDGKFNPLMDGGFRWCWVFYPT